jgi:hypothetical protein
MDFEVRLGTAGPKQGLARTIIMGPQFAVYITGKELDCLSDDQLLKKSIYFTE